MTDTSPLNRGRRLALYTSAGIAALAISTPVFAQDAEDDAVEVQADAPAPEAENAIVVTGSRIRRPNRDTLEPSIVVNADQIEERGLTNVGEVLNEQPAFGPPASSAVGGQSGSFGSGQSFINFFGLGSQRTLTLVNSRRYVSSNTASIFGPVAAGSQVDLNTIPTLMVDRLETIAVGGAPIYGADAIAGTVNIILRDRFEGVRFDAQMGIAEEGDAQEYRLGAMVGTSFADGRGNVVAAFEYNKTEGLLYTDRERTAQGLFYAAPNDPNSPFDNVVISDRRIPILSEFGAPTTIDVVPGFGFDITDGSGNTLVFDANGNLTPLDFGERYGVVNSAGGNGFSLLPVSNLLSPVERYLGALTATYDVTDSITAFLEGQYANSKGTELRSQPVYNTWLFDDAGTPDGNLIVPLSNPFLSDEARATIGAQLPAGQDFFYLGRANTDLIAGEGSSTVEVYRVVAGLRGDFYLGSRNLNWEVSGLYGRSRTEGRSRELVQQNFENALAGCPAGADNSPIGTISDICAPFNPFGNQNSQAVADYVTTIANPTATNEQYDFIATVGGDLFNIWSGPVGFSIGYEHRDESADFDPGAFFFGQPDPADPDAPRTQFGRSIPIDPVSGSYNTDEVFGELQIPLVSPSMDVPFVNLLEAKGAIRYVDNSLTGGDITWTAGGRWKPVEDFAIRGNFTRSIRAPAITELFNPNSAIFTTADDPCDARFINAGPNPAQRAANCAADGLPANFTSNIVDFTTRGSLSGNTELENETADSWTIGAVFTPTFAPGLTLSVDWVDIALEGAIQSVDAEGTLEACYDANDFPNSACDRIDRDGAGQVEFIRTGYLNVASYDYQGVIADLRWTEATPFLGADSRISLRGSYQYIDKLEQQVGTGDLSTFRGSPGYSKHQATVGVTYENNGFGAFTQIQYIGENVVDPDAAPTSYQFFERDEIVYMDAGISFHTEDDFTFRFIVENLFDRSAPYPAPTGGGLTTYFDGIMGRYFKVAATFGF
ncbi:TonB-dependent receptor domain-containing protein [Qipengyuania sp. Mu-71]|jgi:outer membrane receptor protein involved in Fe transport|uniref:TonB-dependent receptor domain-containing protein n=1 Tax=Qipengyuania sp. Mu-71 TaxID=3121477 RepID=UPI002FE47972